ncbi:MAG: thiolase family protein [Pirellulaceae bacterium]|nr:thiolase family protein [Pirellulaceae bacterium]
MSEVAILGVGMTPFTKQAQRGYELLAAEAVYQALAHANVRASDIQASFCGAALAPSGLGQRVLKNLGLTGRPIINVENACASGSSAVVEACAWLRAGLCDVALAVGVEILSNICGPLPTQDAWYFDTGLNLPGWYALQASRHMHEFGLTREQLATVAVKNRKLAAANPRAYFQSPVTLEDVLESRMIADPLTLLQCCPKADGAAAVVLSTTSYAARCHHRPVRIRGMSLTSGQAVFRDGPRPTSAARRAALMAFEQAGVGPEDLDMVECHDAFTIGEILYTEELGLCEPGGGGDLVASGATSPGGSSALVNGSGGLLAKGHPLGATGIAQLAELVWQLRGEGGARQHSRARLAAALTMGAGEFEIDANACTVFVLEGA